MKTCLKCHCGQRLTQRDVMMQGYYVRKLGPSYIYVKYRCSRCKKLGEHFIKQNEWHDGLLHDHASELTSHEREHFDNLGPISLNEMCDFHNALDDLQTLPDLLTNE